jgi:DNA-binding transcriptional LysR family regulator
MIDSIMSADVQSQLELRHLVALRAVAEARSFGRAADRLGYTQSAVSQQIAALERVVGTLLFDRPGGPKQVELTSAGEVLLRHAEAILDRVQAAEADLASYHEGRIGRLSVGTFQSVSVKLLPEVLRRLRNDRPLIEVTLHENDEQTELLKGLDRGDLDLTFMVADEPDERYDVIELADDPFVVMSPADDPLTPVGIAVPAEKLTGLPIIGQTPSSCQLLVENGLRQIGAEPKVVFRTADNSAVQAMVRSGMGHSVMPLLAIDPDDPGIAVRAVDPPMRPRTIAIAIPPQRQRSPAVDAFIDIARAVAAELLPGTVAASAG